MEQTSTKQHATMKTMKTFTYLFFFLMLSWIAGYAPDESPYNSPPVWFTGTAPPPVSTGARRTPGGATGVPVSAKKTYTPAQLRTWMAEGHLPPQGWPATRTEHLDMRSCLARIEAVVSSIGPHYPVQTLVNTPLLRTEKVWTNDAAMTLSCSGLDQKLIITTAPYL
jgi:hypothetical protein